MRLKKFILILLHIILLLGCVGIVWLVGSLSGHDGRQESMVVQTGGDDGRDGGPATASDAEPTESVVPDDRDMEESSGHTETADAQEREKQRQAWLDARRRDAMKQTEEEAKEPEEEVYTPPTIMLASDLHYMSSTTHDEGSAFWKMAVSDDGKVNQYSEEMLDVLVETAIASRPSALVLAGDITLNGERENHERLAEKLRRVQDAGVPVVVIPGNHDINNKNAATYFGDRREAAEYLHSAEDFLEIYHEFGYDQSPNRDPASLSYVYPVDAGHWLLMLDSCQYETGNHVNGKLRPETLAWLEVHLQVAKEHGIEVLPVAHHNLLSESRLYTTDCTLENHDQVTALLEKYQVPLYVSGHLHAQRIKKHRFEPGVPEDTYGIWEIVLSPYSISPNQYGELYWNTPEDMAFTTKRVDVESYAAKQGSGDENLLQFTAFSEAFLKQVITAQIMKKITLVPDDLKREMAGLYAELYYNYCAGNRMSWDSVRTTAAYRLWQRVDPGGRYTAELGQMIEDVREDLHDWSPQTQNKTCTD